MVPSVFVSLNRLPLTANGKVDARALPPPDAPAGPPAEPAVAPRNEIEQEVARIWAGLLGRNDFGIHDDFFRLGGHSLMAIRLFAQIEERFAKQLPLATLFHRPTVAQLAAALAAAAAVPSPSLVPIQPRGTRPPFFCVHGIGGEAFFLKRLLPYMDPDQPVYGLRAHGLDGTDEPDSSIEAMAARYVRAIRMIAPTGPYYLSGFSSGGSVAYEMAQQLRAGGHEVGLLAIVDHDPPNRPQKRVLGNSRAMACYLRNSWYWLLDDMLHTRPDRLFRRGRGKLRVLWHRLFRRLRGKPQGPNQLDVEAVFGVSQVPARFLTFAQAHYRALQEYRPRVYPGRIDIVRARTEPLFNASIEPSLGWEALATGGVKVHMIRGTHDSLFAGPHVNALAGMITACLHGTQMTRRENLNR
jgi:thioesterase domain-containing protein/acyl carrier protein